MEGQFDKPYVIGKSAVPRCFRNLNVKHLPVTWKFNNKAWMTSKLFEEWIMDFNRRMRHAGRHVLLLLDNAPSHSHDLTLSNVKTVFLPASTTSKLQPFDQGIIQNVKQVYRKRLIRSVLSKIKDDETVTSESLAKSVTVLDATCIQWVSAAVKEVKSETVTKCFKKAGVVKTGQTSDSDNDDEENLPLNELRELVRATRNRLNIQDDMTLDQYVNIDNDVPVTAELSENWQDDLLEIVRDQTVRDCDGESVRDDDDDYDEPVTCCKIKTHEEALEWIRDLKMYCLQKDIHELMTPFETAEDLLKKQVVKTKCGSKQTTMESFFKPL